MGATVSVVKKTLLLSLASSSLLASCGPSVDCEALCRRTLACEVTFDAPDDPSGSLIQSGERTDLEACTLGCEDHPLVTVERAGCVDQLDTSDANVCQRQVLACLEIDGASAR